MERGAQGGGELANICFLLQRALSTEIELCKQPLTSHRTKVVLLGELGNTITYIMVYFRKNLKNPSKLNKMFTALVIDIIFTYFIYKYIAGDFIIQVGIIQEDVVYL